MNKIKKYLTNLLIFIKSKKGFYPYLFGNLIIIFSFSIFLFLIFFYAFLPLYTRHNKEILVPNLKGKQFEEIKDILKDKKLRFSIKDKKSYSSDYPANAILNQDPLAGSKVKKNRTIYVSLNSEKPPIIKMPDLLHGSLRNAELILKANELRIGYVKYVSNIAKNSVLSQNYQSKKIQAGDPIPKGSKINLTVGAGLGKTEIPLPNLINKTLEEAQNILKRYGFQLGSVIYEKLKISKIENENDNSISQNDMDESEEDSNVEKKNEFINKVFLPNTIFKQIPEPSQKVRLGTVVDIWLVDYPERKEDFKEDE